MLAFSLIQAGPNTDLSWIYTSYLVYCYSLSLLEHMQAVRISSWFLF